jgi:hypothetical protein
VERENDARMAFEEQSVGDITATGSNRNEMMLLLLRAFADNDLALERHERQFI